MAPASTKKKDYLPEKDPYRYGWRPCKTRGLDGRVEIRYVPLTYQDLLNPQLGDQMPQDTLHDQISTLLLSLLRAHFAGDPEVGVFGDLKVFFDLPGLPNPGPDVVVARGVRDRDRRRTSFRAREEPGRIVLVIEVVSPDYKEKDYKSLPKVYERAGVDEYLIIEALGTYLTDPYKLTAYRLGEGRRYQAIEHDRKGGLELTSVGLWIAPDPDGWGLQIVDQATGERLLTLEEEKTARELAERRALAEASRAAEEARGRRAAEKRAAEEARARKVLEKKLARLEKERERPADKR